MASPRQSTSSFESISELFNCYICTERLKEAAMCPHCSQIGCIACVKRWTDAKKECPHCRGDITADQLIRVPIFDDLIEQMRTDQHQHLMESSGKDLESKMCSEHGRSIEVYCSKCNMFICHECALWGMHRGHTLEKPDDYYKKQTTVIEEKLNNLKEYLKTVLDRIEHTEKNMADLKHSHSKSAQDIDRVATAMRNELDKHTKSNMRMLDEVKCRLEAHSKAITATSLELNAKMRTRSFSSLLTQTGDLRKEIETKLEKIRVTIASFDTTPSMEPFVNKMVPNYEYGKLIIQPFQAKQIQGEEIFSDALNIDGMAWRLKVYPNGHKEDTGKYLSVFIELASGFERKANYQYTIIMLFGGSEKYPYKNYHKDYESDFSDGESWGYRKFYDLTKLKEDGFLKNDTIVLRFGVRAPSYCQKCSDLNLHVQRLEQTQKTLKQKVAELQEQKGHHQGLAPQTSPGHSSSKKSIPSPHHGHSRSHAVMSSHQHSYSDDFSRDPPPPHSDALRRSHHTSSTQQLQSPSHHPSHSPSHSSPRRSESRRSVQANTMLHPPQPLRIERRRSSVDKVARASGPTSGSSPWLHTSMGSGLHVGDYLRPEPPNDQTPATLPKAPAASQQTIAVRSVENSELDGVNSQPSDLEDIKLIINDDDTVSESSMRTVVGNEPCLPLVGGIMSHGNSQPGFDDGMEHRHLQDYHLSSQPTSHDFEPSGILYERDTVARRELNLSQATATTSSSKRLQKSLTDLSTLTSSTTNLHATSYLSQSVLEVSEGKAPKVQASPTTQRATPTTSAGHQRGGRRRDSAPNVNGPVGLASTVSAALWNTSSVGGGGGQVKNLGHSGRSSSSSSINLEIL